MGAAFGFAFVAGLASMLSPCVLPLVPLVLAPALSTHRFGPLVLAGGLAMSFTIVGLFVATIGYALNIDGSVFRSAGAIVMVLVGLMLLVPSLQVRFATVSGPVANWADQRMGHPVASGLAGQFGIGLLLGLVWSPCVGPTLGAASLMAAQGHNLGEVACVMLFFGIGAAVPLLALGVLSRQTLQIARGGLLDAGKAAKIAIGLLLVLFGGGILFGLDKIIEAVLVDWSPAWLVSTATRF
ncbi:cytochrome c biogenesis CcdA family protein [Lichenifustis flavocetrariae]|uniref:Sulfite exporter TauE/SafE family protein n=1 Tax=Lichenifustis flavocetrariae TaxID=2949735 RepID=A0AA42CH67_9HYPH|nr:cytochrome c biogenesis protein CcdA [Lichenifustis flavocetrariae]MCW6507263.1 sulfite exporter TauE/SafE family protein [Lichenifustis flavocetrariae]